MNLEILSEDSYLSIYLDKDNHWLYTNWKGDQDFDTVKEGCLKMLELVQERKLTKVLNNNLEVTSSWSDAANWGGLVWFPEMETAGVTHFAWVYSPVIYSRLSMDLFIAYSEKGPKIKTFDDLEKAYLWLKEQ